jgi:hypothetical protein
MKKKKIFIILSVIISITFIAGIAGVGYFVFMYYDGNYHNTSVTRLILYLEKNYAISFPQSISNAKAAEANTGFDGSSTFILKFQIDPDELNAFLTQFGEIPENLKTYTSEADNRIGDKYLSWFKSPIEAGQVGSVNIRGYNPIDIYIDASNKSTTVIYMEGIYRM